MALKLYKENAMRASATDCIACLLGLDALGPRVALTRQLTHQQLVDHQLDGHALLLSTGRRLSPSSTAPSVPQGPAAPASGSGWNSLPKAAS